MALSPFLFLFCFAGRKAYLIALCSGVTYRCLADQAVLEIKLCLMYAKLVLNSLSCLFCPRILIFVVFELV